MAMSRAVGEGSPTSCPAAVSVCIGTNRERVTRIRKNREPGGLNRGCRSTPARPGWYSTFLLQDSRLRHWRHSQEP
jgi:hypothetical protein